MSFKSFLGWLSNENDSHPQNDPVQWKEKRRENRVELVPGKELEVHLLSPDSKESATTLVARVRNVSMRGCHLIFSSSQDRDKAEVGKSFVASLAVDDFPIPLNVKVLRWIGEKEVGLQFKPPFPRELEKLEKFLEPRCLGRSLREIDPMVLQKPIHKGLRWFQGVNETNLFSWDDQQQLVFSEKVVEWREGQPIRTGRIRPDVPALEDGLDWVKSELLDFDATPDSVMLVQAQAILESSRINETVKKRFLDKLKEK